MKLRLVCSSADRKDQSGSGIRINPAHRGHCGLVLRHAQTCGRPGSIGTDRRRFVDVGQGDREVSFHGGVVVVLGFHPDRISRCIGFVIESHRGLQRSVRFEHEERVVSVPHSADQTVAQGRSRIRIGRIDLAHHRSDRFVFRNRQSIRNQIARSRVLKDVGHRDGDGLLVIEDPIARPNRDFVSVVASRIGRVLKIGSGQKSQDTSEAIHLEARLIRSPYDRIRKYGDGIRIAPRKRGHCGLIFHDA